MADRTTQAFELDLDTFWNDLVLGKVPRADAPELQTIELIANLDALAPPRPEFLDELWTSMTAQETEPRETTSTRQTRAAIGMPAAPLPPPIVFEQQPALQRWGKVAAAIAALLVVTVVGALLFTNRLNNGNPATAAQRWSMTGGNPGKTNANPDSSPITDPAIHWHIETNGRIDAAPVVFDGIVYIGNGEHHLVALDAETGLQRWNANLRKPITQTAGVSDGIVVAGTSSTLFGLDIDTGKPRWQRDDLAIQSAPVIAGETIYIVDTDNRLRALSIETGVDIWSSEPLAGIPAFAIDIENNRLIASTSDGRLATYSTGDGNLLWENDPGLGSFGTPLVDGNDVFVPVAGGVVRIDGATGEIATKNTLDFQEIPTLALAGKQLMASAGPIVVSYDRDTLEVEWNNRLLTGLTGGLSVGSSSMYLSGEDRTLTALDRKTGEVQWILPLGGVAQIAPAVTDAGLFVATRDGAVLAIGDGAATVLNAPTAPPEDDNRLASALWMSTGGPNALKNPTGITVAPSGEIWVCDTANDRLQIFDSMGKFLRNFGAHGSAPGEFDFGEETAEMDGHAPLGHHCSLDFDASGALYVADAANHRIQRFPARSLDWLADSCCMVTIDGASFSFPESMAQPDLIIGSEGTGDGQFLFASDVAVAQNGDIYVGDRHRIDVQRFDATGAYIETIGDASDPLQPDAFLSIVGIAIDTQGRLHIVDDSSQTIARRELDGSWTVLQLSRRDYRINGIAVDDRGNLFVGQIETIGGFFTIYDASGNPLGRVGAYGTALGQFDATTGLALDGQGRIYVTDWAANRFQKLTLDYEQIDAIAATSSG